MSLTDGVKPTDITINTDLYQLTMAQAYWQNGLMDMRSNYNLFYRDKPFKGGYAVCCGTEQIQDLVNNFVFEDEDIEYLSSLKDLNGGQLFDDGFLEYLRNFKLDLDIWAMREGEVVFPNEPIVRIQGNAISCQIIETALLNLINFQTLVATKASRVVHAAKGRIVSDFGLRRAQGPDGGLMVARASYVGGVDSTSNVLAGKIYGIPVYGTHAHSWVMSFPEEIEAFRAFAKVFPRNCSLLIDTYNVQQGIENAIVVAKEMEAEGERLASVRIDSGDLAKLSRMARKRFDEEGLDYVKISVSNDLDEYTIESLLLQGAPIDAFGVGTKLATCDPEPSLGGVYKLSARMREDQDQWQPVMKLSEQLYKRTIPGVQDVIRFYNEEGRAIGDVICDQEYIIEDGREAVDILNEDIFYSYKDAASSKSLLRQIVRDGKPCTEPVSLEESRAYAKQSISELDVATRRFLNPQIYSVGVEMGLANLRSKLVRQKRRRPRR